MPANPKCKIKLMHSARGMTVLETTWSGLGWDLFGGNEVALKPIYESLKATKKAEYTDASGTLYIEALGDIDGS